MSTKVDIKADIKADLIDLAGVPEYIASVIQAEIINYASAAQYGWAMEPRQAAVKAVAKAYGIPANEMRGDTLGAVVMMVGDAMHACWKPAQA